MLVINTAEIGDFNFGDILCSPNVAKIEGLLYKPLLTIHFKKTIKSSKTYQNLIKCSDIIIGGWKKILPRVL